jgi:NADP-dependent 3-hydroxy acid dehydrogenase YdfG
MADARRSVLITGASSGIGLATAHHLIDQGWRVLAAARRVEAMEPLRSRGAEIFPLDLVDPSPARRSRTPWSSIGPGRCLR